MKNYAFQEVKENYSPELQKWYDSFEQANRMEILAYEIAGYSTDMEICEKMNKRMKLAWDKVKELELFPTFINGILTDKAAYYLNGIKILKLTNQI